MAITKLGGLWAKTSKKGTKYLSGLDIKAIQKLDADRSMIMIFKNDKKGNEKAPDFNVVSIDVEPRQNEYKPKPLPPPGRPDVGEPDDFGF